MPENNNKIFLAIALILFVPVGSVWRGYVLVELWDWFIAPFGVGPIGIAHAIGVSLFVSMLTYRKTPEDPDKSVIKQMVEALGLMVLSPPMFWAMGAIIHAFM